MGRLGRFLAVLAVSAFPAAADEVTETLQSAIDAYETGDAQYALEELEYARQLLLEQKAGSLRAFLPEAPDGWTREVSTEMNAGLAMMGGGTGAEATYRGEGESITITIMADNPIVSAMGGMIGNAAALGARIERVGRQKFMSNDGELNGLVDNRVLVKASGGDTARMIALLEGIDFRGLGRFGL